MQDQTQKIAQLATNIRQCWHNDRWYFSVIDVIAALTESAQPQQYWSRLKKRVKKSSEIDLEALCTLLTFTSNAGKTETTECADTETMLHIIQYIPTPKAEPFKRWLAQTANDRLKELSDPEAGLAAVRERAIQTYMARGYGRQEAHQLAYSLGAQSAQSIRELAILAFTEAMAVAKHMEHGSEGIGELRRDVQG